MQVLDLQPKVRKVPNFLVNHFNDRVSKCWMKTSDEGRSRSTTGSVPGQKICGASNYGGHALGIGVTAGLILFLLAVISGGFMQGGFISGGFLSGGWIMDLYLIRAVI